MITSRQQNIVQYIVIENLLFEKVEKLKYLGVMVNEYRRRSQRI